MIIRQLLPRRAGPRFVQQQRCWQWRRAYSIELSPIESAIENSLKQTNSIDSAANDILPTTVLPHDGEGRADLEQDMIAQRHQSVEHQRNTTARYGTTLAPHYEPHTLLSNPPGPADVTLELLLASQAHLGHSTSLWHPGNSRYIFGIREGIHIISLDVTAAHLRRAAKVVSGVTERGGLVLFVGTRSGFDRCVVKAAQMAGGCHLFERWTPGSITNGQQILGKCRMKVVNEFDDEIPGFDDQLSDRAVLKPDLVVCLNPTENYVLLHECGIHNIPTIGIIDTDANPTWVTYPIPANDDSLRCVQVIAGVLGRAGEEGKAMRLQAAKRGFVPYSPARNLEMPTAKPDTQDKFQAEVQEKGKGEGATSN